MSDGQSTNHAAGCMTCGAVVLVAALGCVGGVWWLVAPTSPGDAPPPIAIASSAAAEERARRVEELTLAVEAPTALRVDLAAIVAEPTPRASPTPPPSLLGYDLSDDRDVRELTASMGSIAAVYQAATPDEREDLLALLQSTGRLRLYLGELLVIENDTATRATMLGAVEPQGFFEGSSVDPELAAVLNQDTPTPIGESEWLARIDLGARHSDAMLNSTLARIDAAGAHTPATRMLVDVWRAQATDTGAANRTHREAARQRLRALFDEGADSDVDGAVVARGYEAIAAGPDAAADMDWWVARLGIEQRPAAREALARIIERLARQGP